MRCSPSQIKKATDCKSAPETGGGLALDSTDLLRHALTSVLDLSGPTQQADSLKQDPRPVYPFALHLMRRGLRHMQQMLTTNEPLTLAYLMHEEGRLRRAGSELAFEYYLKDHLGNTRVMFGDNDGDNIPEALQEDHYYPFGLKMSDGALQAAARNVHLYNGKEIQDELGLGWYDYGARMLNPTIGRWNGVDALSEDYLAWSPFNYTLGNPIRFIDPDGNEVIGVTRRDAAKMHEDINTVFADEKFQEFRGLITRSGKKGNGATFNKIDQVALSEALEGLEGDDLALAQLVAGAINSDDKHKVEFASLGDDLSEGAVNGMNETIARLYTENGLTAPAAASSRTADEVHATGGSGQNFPSSEGSHSVVLEGNGIQHPEGRRELTTFHEVFGHGIATAKKASDIANNTNAIRTENLVRRVLGISTQRDGANHSGGKVVDPSALPAITY